MKIIKPSVEFFGAVPTDYDSTLKFIEMAGRTCYRSEDKITEDSAEKFVRGLIRAGHLAMVEHSNFVVCRDVSEIPGDILETTEKIHGKYLNPVLVGSTMYIGGNLTAWYQQGAVADWAMDFCAPFKTVYGELFSIDSPLRHIPTWKVCPHDEIPPELHRYSAKFVCDRGVSHEIVRHRPCSFAQESTRYVNYSGKDMEFIEPAGYDGWDVAAQLEFELACNAANDAYDCMIWVNGLKPQQARAVLPNALRTEIVVTADAKEWAHIRKLRAHKSAHPDIQRVMNMVPWEVIR